MAETFRSRIYKRLPAQLKMVLLKIKSNESYFSLLGFFNLFFLFCVCHFGGKNLELPWLYMMSRIADNSECFTILLLKDGKL